MDRLNNIVHKQKEETLKGDWLSSISSDFEFLKIQIDEKEIASTPKSIYDKKIKDLMNEAVFDYLVNEKKLILN